MSDPYVPLLLSAMQQEVRELKAMVLALAEQVDQLQAEAEEVGGTYMDGTPIG